jgi:hypothetical protein
MEQGRQRRFMALVRSRTAIGVGNTSMRLGSYLELCRVGPNGERVTRMQDAQMLLFTAVFFAVAFLYVKACQKLR